MTVDDATVTTSHDMGPPDRVWDLTLKDEASLDVGALGILSIPGTGTVGAGLTDNSILTFTGSNNTIETTQFELGGALVASGARAELDVTFDDSLLVSAELVRIVNNETVIIDFDAEKVTLNAVDSDNPLDPFGPDYAGYFMLDDDDDPIHVLFTDSPCARRWKKVAYPANEDTRILQNYYCSTPISVGGLISCPHAPSSGGVPEALYVVDLQIDSGATLDNEGINIYYTGTYTNNGTLDGAGSVIQLTPTVYGDFNAQSMFGADMDDVDFFNDAFPSDIGDTEYNPLVDADCDGDVDVDCDDRTAFVDNYSEADDDLEDCP